MKTFFQKTLTKKWQSVNYMEPYENLLFFSHPKGKRERERERKGTRTKENNLKIRDISGFS